jgi:integrase
MLITSIAAGVDVRTVAGRLGHRNPSTTLNVYSHFVPESDQDAADALGRIFEDAANLT